jgi:hypothetical protein
MENMQFSLKVCKFKDLGSFKVRPWRAAGNLKVHTIKVKITIGSLWLLSWIKKLFIFKS